MPRAHTRAKMVFQKKKGDIVIKQQRDEDLDDRPPPWAVVVKIEKPSTVRAPSFNPRAGEVAPDVQKRGEVMVEPVYKDGGKPWADTKDVKRDFKVRPLPTGNLLNLPSEPHRLSVLPESKKQTDPAKTTSEPSKPSNEPSKPSNEAPIMLPPSRESELGRERVCVKNYAAMDAETGAYGLIGSSSGGSGGVRSLVMHVPRKVQHQPRGAYAVLSQVRAGSILKVRRTPRRGQPNPPIRELLVRFTTPARYYGPGSDVTTLGIGVDEAEWQGVLN
jgi:hypothetical protein